MSLLLCTWNLGCKDLDGQMPKEGSRTATAEHCDTYLPLLLFQQTANKVEVVPLHFTFGKHQVCSKGCVAAHFDHNGLKMCVVNAHLEAGHGKVRARNEMFAQIASKFPTGSNSLLLLLGDLNYRVEGKRPFTEPTKATPVEQRCQVFLEEFDEAVAKCQAGKASELQERCQLRRSRGDAPFFENFEEAEAVSARFEKFSQEQLESNELLTRARYDSSPRALDAGRAGFLAKPPAEGTKRPYPLLLFLHGSGERGHEDGRDLGKVRQNGPWSASGAERFFLVAPQCPQDAVWPALAEQVVLLTREVLKTYELDTSRCYITGLSMGGFGAWAAAYLAPELYTAMVAVCGGFTKPLPRETSLSTMLQLAKVKPKGEDLDKLRDLPVWLFHGLKDKIVDADGSLLLYEALGGKARGFSKLRLTKYGELGHTIWSSAYKTQGLFNWLLGKRGAKPGGALASQTPKRISPPAPPATLAPAPLGPIPLAPLAAPPRAAPSDADRALQIAPELPQKLLKLLESSEASPAIPDLQDVSDDVTWDEWDTEPTGDASESDASDAPLQSFSAAIVIANHSLVDDIG
ncbi:unnamed protein product [Cladocopium goreaui]|uniref:Inositol polyphosphate-related phosphatase domain-containing protein n=1 Tax=Cladocopium goreaui TaxID=2562237 RepID=A0A9P1M4X8_9DINO|nr:unnamed protein product [Cladocopium goreaui]